MVRDEGRPIAVTYFPLYPAHNRLDESRSVPILACTHVPFVVLGDALLVLGPQLIRSSGNRPARVRPILAWYSTERLDTTK
jgi:hypothetical protein